MLVVGGERATAIGPFESTLAVLRTGVLQESGVTHVAVAGFPEDNSNFSNGCALKTLLEKIDFGLTGGLAMSIVTQFCFASEPIIEFLGQIRASGIDVPVRVGLAGPAGIVALTRYAIRCGVGNSLRLLSENPAFAQLLTEKGPEPIIRGLATCARESFGGFPLGISGLHFFTFGGFERTVDWIHANVLD